MSAQGISTARGLPRHGGRRTNWPALIFFLAPTVIAFLVFCTIPDAEAAAREAYRVLAPSGQLLFFEHVVSPKVGVRRWQERIDPLWTKLACGCHLTRDTTRTFRDAGFRFTDLDAFEHPKIPALASAMIRGSATR